MSTESGKLLKRFVEESNLTHEEVVRRTGLTTRMLWRLYKGEADPAKDSRLDKIAEACHFSKGKTTAILELMNLEPKKAPISEATENFGGFVSAMRRRSQKNMKDLANDCGLRESNFSLIESGKIVPNPATASRIATYLKLSPDLLGTFFQLYGNAVKFHSDFSKSVSSPALVAMLEWSLLAHSLSTSCKTSVGEAGDEEVEQALRLALEHANTSLRKPNSITPPHAKLKVFSGETYLFLPLLIKQNSA